MPAFELAEKDTNVVGKATFTKESDYMVVTLKGDSLNTPHLVHVLHGNALIKKGAAEKSKAAIEEREVETVVTKAPKEK